MEDSTSWAILISTTVFLLIIIMNVVKLNKELEGSQSLISLTAGTTLMLLIVTIPSVIAIPMFWIYKQLIQCYLKFVHGSRFIGMIEGTDATYASNEKSDSVVMALFVYEISADTKPSDVFENLRNLVNTHFIENKEKLQKFHCTIHYFNGYMYMLKENVTLNDCVRNMNTINDKEEITKDELITLINQYKDTNFLNNDRLLWDVVIGTQPVKWNSKTGVKYYPTLFRFHHAICDGFSFGQFIFGVAADEGKGKNTREAFIKKTTDASPPTMLVIEQLVKKKEYNILHGPKLKKVSVFTAKVDDGAYFKKIKYIKSSVPGVSFSDVVFAALSYSLHEYFQKHSSTQPKYLPLVIPFLQKAIHLQQLPAGKLTVDDIILNNTFDLLNLDLPITIENVNQNTPHQQRLKAIRKQSQQMAASTTNKVLHFATHFLLQILPLRILRYIINTMEWASIVSILPGPEDVTMCNGAMSVENIVSWVPRMKGVGCNFSVISYGNKIQLGLSVDSALIPNEKEAKTVLDNTFIYLELLEKEIKANI
ncbi:hypothetical protein FQR65_LT08747 [Abscondita terminalis]|nr:hypothetical protein FQR65_LT08747 [Abscondita terminalis]